MPGIKQYLKKYGKRDKINMNGKQYNNVIDWTIKHELAAKSDDSLETARAIFKNMGVALPNGRMKEVSETLKTDNYMGWRSCSIQAAQEAIDNGIPAIGISENRMVVLRAANEEYPVVETASVMTLSEITSAYAESNLDYYSYSYDTTESDGGNAGNTHYTNNLFNTNNKTALLNELVSIMGNKQDVLSYNTTSECVDTVLEHDASITSYCNLYSVPKQLVQTLLLRELWCVDATDTVADEAVMSYFRWMQECEDWGKLSDIERLMIPRPQAPIVMSEDSSTGIGQMFAWVAIDANNLAIDKGLINTERYNKSDWHDCRKVWSQLNSNDYFAIKMTALEMHHCADYVGIHGSLYECTESQIKGILSRYNGTGAAAIAYGNECYKYYKIFKKYS